MRPGYLTREVETPWGTYAPGCPCEVISVGRVAVVVRFGFDWHLTLRRPAVRVPRVQREVSAA